MVNQTDKPVMASECTRKHRTTTVMLGFLITLMVCCVGVIGWSVTASQRAGSRANEMEIKVKVEGARQEEQLGALQKSMDRVEVEQQKQRGMIEDLWRQGKRINP